MSESKTVDARGLSCPQPVMLTMDEIESARSGQIVILVDTDTSRENVSRAARNKGWEVATVQPDGEGYQITIAKNG